MAKWLHILFALVLLAILSLKCTGVSRETKVRCPRCGAVFAIEEGFTGKQIGVVSSGSETP